MLDLFGGTAWAQAAQSGASQPGFLELFGMPLAFLVIMYFLILRPQQKKHRAHQDLVKSLKAGDEVVTSGGIIARIRSVSEGFVTVDTGGTQLKIQKSHISALTPRTQPNPSPKKS